MIEPTPLHLGGDAWLVPTFPGDEPLRLPLNSLVLRGPEPVLVDTGSAGIGDQWWSQVGSLVAPEAVRWIFLSHDDADVCGNLAEALDRCPRATVLLGGLLAERLAPDDRPPADRTRYVDDGEHVTISDRRLYVLRPPAYDSPATLGVFDPVSGVYWAADCFGAPVPHPVGDAADLDSDVWTEGFLRYHRQLSPWAAEVEPLRWRAAVGRVAALGARVLASVHGPAIRGPLTGRALDLLGEVPASPAPGARRPQPGRPPISVAAAGGGRG